MSLLDAYAVKIMRAFESSPYGLWQKSEGVATHDCVYLDNVMELDLPAWPRLGGKALFLNLYPMMEGATGLYVGEVPPRGALNAERHLYEKFVVVLSGHGATEVWQSGDEHKHIFE